MPYHNGLHSLLVNPSIILYLSVKANSSDVSLVCNAFLPASLHSSVIFFRFMQVNTTHGGNTLLHYAAMVGKIDCVRVLLEYNADVRVKVSQ